MAAGGHKPPLATFRCPSVNRHVRFVASERIERRVGTAANLPLLLDVLHDLLHLRSHVRQVRLRDARQTLAH